MSKIILIDDACSKSYSQTPHDVFLHIKLIDIKPYTISILIVFPYFLRRVLVRCNYSHHNLRIFYSL